MIFNKIHLICFLVGAFLGICTGFFTAKGIYDKPINAKIERDTVTIHDTIPDYQPAPKDSAHIKYITKWFPVYHTTTDTITNTEYITLHDSVEVEVPITSKHYGNNQYDAWISGYYPTLDSIKVYQKTEYIKETVTLTKPKSKWSIGVQVGYGYGFRSKLLEPYAGLGIGYNF